VSRAAWLVGAAAILPIAAIAAAQAPPEPSSAIRGAFQPAPTPMLLTRTLRHVLHDGQAVVTRRSYRVRFAPDGNGFRLDGTLAEVTVEAPPGLEALADLERKRPDTGMFPMRLDVTGMIVPAPDAPPSPSQRQALRIAASEVAMMNLAPDETEQAQSFVGQFQARPYRTPWPQDLFHPAPGSRHEERVVPLAGGVQGHITTDIDVSADAAGLLSAFRRKVTTDLGGDTRVVLEEWTLAQVP
jgi:hypothetical protein